MTNIGINGFGRIGRLALRRILSDNKSTVSVVAINDLTSPEALAQLFKYDSIHGVFDGTVNYTDHSIIVNDSEIEIYAEKDASNIPWVKNNNVELVLECTGLYTSEEKASAHLKAGVQRVLISAPAGKIKTIVYDVNDDTINSSDKIISAGSCTTNSLAPLAFCLK